MNQLVYKHIEQTLGPISALAGGQDDEGNPFPFRIAIVPECPVDGATTLVTVGLSETPLKQEDGTDIRHELVICAYQRFGEEVFENLIKVMGFMAQSLLAQEEAIAAGDIVDLGESLVSGSPMTALYLVDPLYFPEEFRSMETVKPPVAFAWAVPLMAVEADFVQQEGFKAFETLLEQQDPDLIDLMRDPVQLRKV